MKITQVYRTRNGVVGPTSINGYGIIKINGLRYDEDENKYYDSEDNEVILEEGREYYSNNKLYVYDGKLTELLTDLMIEVKWAELVELRDNKELIPGMKYRITDYQCTTTQHNTQSAGHQFDIVLLALSENKLAEEGWAMMNESNIYDVTFADGVTKKCYIYFYGEVDFNIVECSTLLGETTDINLSPYDLVVDKVNKTASLALNSSGLRVENLTYNYFQNSNLSAWKVWYCLDNDKSRFAWADDSVEILRGALVNGFPRNVTNDVVVGGLSFFCWGAEGTDVQLYKFTRSETPSVGDAVYKKGKRGNMTADGTVNSYTPPEFGSPNGRGVIYRLIDEWNNDVPYDFKNIMFLYTSANNLPNTQGQDNAYFYTFSITDMDNDKILDASVYCKEYVNDEQGEGQCYNNHITAISEYVCGYSTTFRYTLPYIIIADSIQNYDRSCLMVNNSFIGSHNIAIAGRMGFVKFINSLDISTYNSGYEYYDIVIYFVNNTSIFNTWNRKIIIKVEGSVKQLSSTSIN